MRFIILLYFITFLGFIYAQDDLRYYKVNLKTIDQDSNSLINSKVYFIVKGAPMYNGYNTDSLGCVETNLFVRKNENQNYDIDSIYLGEIQIEKEGFRDTSFSIYYYQKTYNENEVLVIVLDKLKPLDLTRDLLSYTYSQGTIKDLIRRDTLVLDSYSRYKKNKSDNYIELIHSKRNKFEVSHYRRITNKHERKKTEKIKIIFKKNDIVVFKFNNEEFIYNIAAKGSVQGGYNITLIKRNVPIINEPFLEIDTVLNYNVSLTTDYHNFFMNGIGITKEEFEHFEGSTSEERQNCCPCVFILKDINEKLVKEYYGCSECPMGFYNLYNPNGSIKVKGYYKEINSYELNRVKYSNQCSIKDGEWTYYDSLGNELYSKYWEDNVCLSTKPDNKTTVLSIESKQLDSLKWNSKIDLDTFLNAEVIVKYNNDLNNNKERVVLEISSFNNEKLTYEIEGFDLKNFKSYFDEFFNEKRMHVSIGVSFMSDNELIKGYGFRLIDPESK